jgi:multiple sugar transport system substrate-binding protein
MTKLPVSPGPGSLSRRDLLTLAAGLGASATLAACGGDGPNQASQGSGGAKGYAGPTVELQFWNGFTGGDGPFMRKLVDQFNKDHPKINVKMTVMQWGDYYTKLPTAVSTGRGPDLGIMHIDSLATNAARQVIVPLDDVANGLKLQESDFAPTVWNAGLYLEKRYGIPLDMHPLGFYFNKKLMEQAGLDPEAPPQNKDDYDAALDAFKSKKIQGQWMAGFPFPGVFMFDTLLWQYGGDLFNADVTRAAYNSEAGVTALTWLVDLVRNGHSPKNVGQDADVIAFQNGKNAFNWNGIWQINDLKKSPDVQWGVAPLPQIGSKPAAWANSHNFTIVKQRKPDPNKQEASKVFINWISERSLEWAKGGQVPARASVRDGAEFKALPEQSVFAEQVDVLHFPPALPGVGDALATIDRAVNEAISMKKEPQAALDAAAERADKLLAENLKKYQR